jgi:RND superfamily putative drug exporter
VLASAGLQLNPAEAQAKDLPGSGDAIVGRTLLTDAGFSPGVMKPFVVLVRNAPSSDAARVVSDLRATSGIAGAAAPPSWSKPGAFLVEAFPTVDGDSSSINPIIANLRSNVLPRIAKQLGTGAGGAAPQLGLGGIAAEDRDFVVAVYSNFPYVLGFVVLITFILLTRAFRSLVLPLKAVILNLLSLAAAYGIIVFIFQEGHGSGAIWGVAATQSIIPWIPLMIFAFLFGLSMDYEVFMLTRIREAYDETGDTRQAISLGLARTGKLVTSAALILMFAFFVLSSAPSLDIKQFGIGLAAGIIFDATVIRALLVPALMRLLGRWNWWLPAPLQRVFALGTTATVR